LKKFTLAATKLEWVGRVITVLVGLPLIPSGIFKIMGSPEVVEGMAHLGLPSSLMMPLGILELGCLVIYLIPHTAILGAVLLTGYFGGAICTHLRLGEPIIVQTLLGVMAWGALYLREPRLRVLLPFRK